MIVETVTGNIKLSKPGCSIRTCHKALRTEINGTPTLVCGACNLTAAGPVDSNDHWRSNRELNQRNLEDMYDAR